MSEGVKKAEQVNKAKKVARANKKGRKVKTHKTYFGTRFHRPRTLMKAKSPQYPRLARDAVKVDPKAQPQDFYTTILYPLSTEKAMKKMEDENTMVFIVNARSNKIQIKRSFEKIYNVTVRQVNTLIRPDGKKKAYIRLSSESDSLSLANKIGII